MDPAAQDAATLGAQKGLLKASCTPRLLSAVIEEVLGGKPAGEDKSHLIAVSRPEPSQNPKRAAALSPTTPPSRLPQKTAKDAPQLQPATEHRADVAQSGGARRLFLEDAPETCSTLRQLFHAFARAKSDTEVALRLKDLYRKVHFVAAMAAIAECHQLAHMAAALEAVLFGL